MTEKKLPRSEGNPVIGETASVSGITQALRSGLVKALEDEKYDWRTVGGLAKELDITEAEVILLLTSMPDQIVRASDADGRSLFTTRNHYEQTHGLGDKVLSALADRIVA